MALGEYQGPPILNMVANYVLSRYKRDLTDKSYRCYVTSQLRLIPQMQYLKSDWGELVGIIKSGPKKTADEIVDDVISRLEAR